MIFKTKPTNGVLDRTKEELYFLIEVKVSDITLDKSIKEIIESVTHAIEGLTVPKTNIPTDPTWMSYKEHMFQKTWYELAEKYFPWPISKEEIKKLEEQYGNQEILPIKKNLDT